MTGCAKTYVARFAEAEGFAHVHFHAVPRMPDLPVGRRGPKVFGVLGRAEAVGPRRMDALSMDLRDHLVSARPEPE